MHEEIPAQHDPYVIRSPSCLEKDKITQPCRSGADPCAVVELFPRRSRNGYAEGILHNDLDKRRAVDATAGVAAQPVWRSFPALKLLQKPVLWTGSTPRSSTGEKKENTKSKAEERTWTGIFISRRHVCTVFLYPF